MVTDMCLAVSCVCVCLTQADTVNMTDDYNRTMQILCAVYRYPGWCSASEQRDPAGMEEVERMEGLMEM